MAAPAEEAQARFTVKSGGLCFGALNNIWTGASVPLREGMPDIRPNPHAGGTVIYQKMEYTVPAQNGTWLAYHLVDLETKLVSGWFVCHSDVDAGVEIDKILRVSSSPYEEVL
jgi:hypothetical protein